MTSSMTGSCPTAGDAVVVAVGDDEPEAFFAHSTVAGSETNANSTHTRAATNFKNQLMFITKTTRSKHERRIAN